MKDFSHLMKQAKEMQERMSKLQEDLGAMEVEGAAGAGLVTVTLSGKGELRRVKIDPSLLKPGDGEMVEDLVVAAHGDAKRKLEERIAHETQGLMGGMALPPGLKLPF